MKTLRSPTKKEKVNYKTLKHMERIKSPLNGTNNKSALGFADIFSAATGLVDSFVEARTERKSDESDERQLQLQIAAEREQAQMEDARLSKLLKFAAIAGSVLLVGVVVVTVIKSDSQDDDKKAAVADKGKSSELAGMKRKGGIKKLSIDRKAARP